MLNTWITIVGHFDCSPDDGGYAEYKVEIQKESEDTIMRRGMITSIDTTTQAYKMFTPQHRRIKCFAKRRKKTKRWI